MSGTADQRLERIGERSGFLATLPSARIARFVLELLELSQARAFSYRISYRLRSADIARNSFLNGNATVISLLNYSTGD